MVAKMKAANEYQYAFCHITLLHPYKSLGTQCHSSHFPDEQMKTQIAEVPTLSATGHLWPTGATPLSTPPSSVLFNLWPALLRGSHRALSSWGHILPALLGAVSSVSAPRVDIQSNGSCLPSRPWQGCRDTLREQVSPPTPPSLNQQGGISIPFRYKSKAACSPGLHTKSCYKLHHEWQPFFAQTPAHHCSAAWEKKPQPSPGL